MEVNARNLVRHTEAHSCYLIKTGAPRIVLHADDDNPFIRLQDSTGASVTLTVAEGAARIHLKRSADADAALLVTNEHGVLFVAYDKSMRPLMKCTGDAVTGKVEVSVFKNGKALAAPKAVRRSNASTKQSGARKQGKRSAGGPA